MGFDSNMRLGSENAEQIALVCARTGQQISYGELIDRITAFTLRFEMGRGIVLIECTNALNAIIAYLASLHANCPALLVNAEAKAQRDQLMEQFPVLYTYATASDHLDVLPQHRDADLHPDLALLLSTSGSTGEQKLVRLSHSNLLSIAIYSVMPGRSARIWSLPGRTAHPLACRWPIPSASRS